MYWYFMLGKAGLLTNMRRMDSPHAGGWGGRRFLRGHGECLGFAHKVILRCAQNDARNMN